MLVVETIGRIWQCGTEQSLSVADTIPCRDVAGFFCCLAAVPRPVAAI
jgi:hypothetical protein